MLSTKFRDRIMPVVQKSFAIPRTFLFPDDLEIEDDNDNNTFCNVFQLVTKRAEMIKFETINLPSPLSTTLLNFVRLE